VELVRGVLATAHVYVKTRARRQGPVEDLPPGVRGRAVRAHREGTAGDLPLPRAEAARRTNFADVGFAADPRGDRVVALCAIDNLMKGAAGNGLQAMNVACGMPEDAGLGFPGLHP
jgi:N-acetyl-gamma-glutamyl-phosphate/LysW-gamma-L-alpha-aminoadipyl-6-phosphate reductase